MKFADAMVLVGGDGTALETDLGRVSAFADATPDAIVFANDTGSLLAALRSSAGMILAPVTTDSEDVRLVRVRDPKYAFALCGRALRQKSQDPLVHPSAVVHASASIGPGTRIDPGVVIEADAVIGRDGHIGSRVTICRGVRIGDRVVLQPGAVLGSLGFGYVRDSGSGEHLLFPQQGSLVIEDDVEIGANTTIDRGALGETRIGSGTKIDNQVHIGHNCRIGRNVLIAAQVGISGSCVVEDGAVLAGQVGLGDHVTVGAGVILGGASGVFPHKQVRGAGEMYMGVPAEPVKRYLKTLARIRKL